MFTLRLSTARRRGPRRTPLGLERLEGRLLLATWVWGRTGQSPASGFWEDALNWHDVADGGLHGVPGPGDTAEIAPGVSVAVAVSSDVTVARVTTSDSPATSARVVVSGGTFRVTGGLGDSTLGALLVPGGALRLDNDVALSLIGSVGGRSEFAGDVDLATGATLDLREGADLDPGVSLGGVGQYRFRGGTFSLNAPVSAPASLEIGGLDGSTAMVLGSARLTVPSDSALLWTGGRLGGSGGYVVAAGGSIELASTADKTLDGAGFTNNGSARITGDGNLVLRGGASFTNAGSMEIRTDADIAAGPGGGIVLNTGTTTKSALSSGTSAVTGLTFQNSGLVEVQGGTFAIQSAGGMNIGILRTFAGTTLGFIDLADDFLLATGSRLQGPGTFRIATAGPTVMLNADFAVANLVLESGILSGPGDLSVSQSLDWTGGAMNGLGATTVAEGANLTIREAGAVRPKTLANRDFILAGNASWTGRGAIVLENATLSILPGATLAIQNAETIAGPLGILDNRGTLSRDGVGTTVVLARLLNSGSLEVREGELRTAFTLTNNGAIVIAPDARLTTGVGAEFEQAPNASLTLQIAGSPASGLFGSMSIGAAALLDGRLTVQWQGGFEPAAGSAYRAMTYTERTGDFALKDGLDRPGGLSFATRYDDTGMNLQDTSIPVVNHAPVVSAIADRTIDEETTLIINATATDEDAGQRRMFRLADGAPTNAMIDPTTGRFSWAPIEAQGPSDSTFTIIVRDDGSTPLEGSTSFRVTVREVNRPPILAAIADRTIDEGAALEFTASASDPDLPANVLRYRLDPGAPSGAVIDPMSGRFTWTPTEDQGPGQYRVSVRVEDNGSPNRDVATAFQVTVREVNRPPILAAIADQSADPGELLSFAAIASDLDSPVNTLRYRLDPGAPAGATIDPVSGRFSWTPGPAQTSAVITIRVADDGSPSREDAKSFAINLSQPTRVVRVETPQKRGVLTGIVVTFSDAMDPATASATASFALVTAGRDRRFNTRDDVVVRLKSASYIAGNRAVTLLTRQRATLNTPLQLTIRGSLLRDARGRRIDGDRDGQFGGDFRAILSRRGGASAARR